MSKSQGNNNSMRQSTHTHIPLTGSRERKECYIRGLSLKAS